MSEQRKEGIVHIYASHNNTLMLLTDITGAETIAKCTGGMVEKSDHKQGAPYTAMKVAEIIAQKARERGIDTVIVKVRGPGGNKSLSPGKGSEAAIRSLTRNGLRIKSIENVTPIPHDGCRKKKKFRKK
ncbi:MAG: 30S ribosomal protein S11 [Candidatus Diapherotrites archaeon]|uniref:Small ribosomal subunit protein uS11 n=1 Tax=Candidatus Iainarchaeum sp. TaxID=3101447 RepID=A0A497JI42_9ARCH|nr:30S ribosomal protein S11 [Candidatus Diapherotrites archaeon]RLG70190.1 MAG: 30S ribosomal protein S11 [Candidatus Diapherotrites archaeon]